MRAAGHKQGSSAGLLLGVASIAAALWGAERWRGHAARRAGASERTRAVALARCVFGRDALEVLRSPAGARARLRRLAFETPARPSLTWLDQCVPLARRLEVHASEVDDTRALTETPSHLRENSKKLRRELQRTGLVWRVRGGDPDLDVAPLVEHFIHVTGELDLSSAGREGSLDGPTAPTPDPLPAGELVPTPGLEPTSIGTPERFFAGAPLPGLVSVSREGGRWTVRTLATASAYAWSIRPGAHLRIDARSGPTPDGLTDLRWIRPGLETEQVRVAPVDDARDGLHTDFDGFVGESGSFWLARWTPDVGAVFGRHATRGGWSSFTLANAPPEASARARHPVLGRTRAFDERVAIAPLGAGAIAAYTLRAGQESTVSLAVALEDRDQPSIIRVGEVRLAARSPDVQFCARADGAPWLFVAGAREWLALEVDARGVRERARVAAPRGETFSERAAVRCDEDRAIMYATEQGRSSPLLACDSARCAGIFPPTFYLPDTLPTYQTRAPDGRPVLHGDWPIAAALSGGSVVFARAAGSIVAVSLRTLGAGAWEPERVVFDASSHTAGQVIEGLGLFALGDDLTLAIGTREGLRVLSSRDRGARWR